jgi:hypothetical protein
MLPRALSAALLLLCAVPLQARDNASKLAGNWKGQTYARGETYEQSREGAYAIRHHTIELSLGDDGTATLTESPNAVSSTTRFGHWTYSEHRLTLTLDPAAGSTTPESPASTEGPAVAQPNFSGNVLVFDVGHGELIPATWDAAVWGKAGPPHLKRE